jgi:hypothetical protein
MRERGRERDGGDKKKRRERERGREMGGEEKEKKEGKGREKTYSNFLVISSIINYVAT